MASLLAVVGTGTGAGPVVSVVDSGAATLLLSDGATVAVDSTVLVDGRVTVVSEP